ncbi:hypothetical protein [Ramlibacter montanisoli]|uniref:Uncharacterized protein n=1 Tax=Ramlibacter montanisoli TaxID=2732512 RepID=A0A849KGZ0_9BURK|nr:hypothetical protein [Ramlibacter montanisoli]NNU44706.1 hypothetical protein [Ramlibacter montanisoli]
MNAITRLLAVGICAAAAASAANAQVRQLSQGTATPRPSTNTTAPSAPNPAGLRPIFPAGISSGSGAAVSSDPIAASTSPIAPAGSATPPTTANPNLPPAELPSPDGNFTGIITTCPTPRCWVRAPPSPAQPSARPPAPAASRPWTSPAPSSSPTPTTTAT